MLFPIRTSITPYRTPYANYLLIAANVVVFALTYMPYVNPFTGAQEALRPWAEQFMLTPDSPRLWQFISYAFLHGNLWHILGNMYFLYLFGNNVNDKLGGIGYLCFYLAGAVFSALGHTFLSHSPVIGASGAVAAVTGAYLVLFPQTLITIVYFLYFVGTMEISALYFIFFKMIIIDNVIARYTEHVAYDAHLAGYAFGIVANLLLLSTGIIRHTQFDMWAMIKQANRRRRYRDVVSSGYDPYNPISRMRRAEAAQPPAGSGQSDAVKQIRDEIASRLSQRNISAAAEAYRRLMQVDPAQVLPRQHLLDVANQLASESAYSEAAAAYEKLLAHYATYEYVEQIQLMLGLIYSRYLGRPDLAVGRLQAALDKLTNPSQVQLCREELAKIQHS